MENSISSQGLLDVLPLRPAGVDDPWQQLQFPLDAAAIDAMGLLNTRHVPDGGNAATGSTAMWLCAALAVVEARLTGVGRAVLTLIADGQLIQIVDSVPGNGTCGQWMARLAGAGQAPATIPELAVWAVSDAPASTFPGASSLWRMHLGVSPRMEVAFRAPLSATSVELLAACVQRALAVMASDAEVSPAAIDVVDPVDLRKLQDWSNTLTTSLPAGTVTSVFSAVCARRPGAVAVVGANASLTYAQLERAANHLACRLQDAGVVPGMVVGLMLDRSIPAVIAMLAVIKSGAAYLPLDALLPPDRLAFMLGDAGVCVAVVGTAPPSTAWPVAVRCVPVDDWTGDDGGTDAGTWQDCPRGGDCLAYVMYTSGSTGTPKGVEIPDRAILRLVCDVDYVELGPDTRMLHCAPLGFDASTLELWGPLLNGGCVVVHDEVLPTGAGIARTIAEHGVTTAWLTAALFNEVVDDDPGHLRGLRELFTGGEALSVGHVRRMRRSAPRLRLCNGYGPTECTTFTCTHVISDVADDTSSIPIGRPIAGTQVHVLNARREAVPIGVSGELYVGGAGLALGYLGQPALTAERFVSNPFGAPGDRLYRTGDHVRYGPDGLLEFIGRRDTQVKIRGFRIELAEIELALARHPGVQSCVVLVHADGAGSQRLVAYYLAHAGAADSPPTTAPGLRAHLCATLPEFMVPARYVQLDRLPVTANGKLDRRALPAPNRDRPELAAAYEPAANVSEQRVCDAFSVQLDIDSIGRHDNFFELGGNSLLATRLLESLRKGPGMAAERVACISATTVFQNPTPATMAAALDAGRAKAILDPARMAAAAPNRRDVGTGAGATTHDAISREPIAIIAMAGRFPGATDVEAFWQNLCEGRDTITRFQPDELDPAVSAADRSNPSYVAARGVLDGVEQFDAAFFGIGPREAELMDPQQRIFLELCWECLERGGHVPDATPGPVGVFAGMYNATYYQRHVIGRPDLIENVGAFQVMLDNEKDYITTRVAHKLNLTGPTLSIHSACSTSLVAICQAVDSLRARRCDMALAGGVSVTCPPRSGYLYQEGAMLSPDGHTRAFDAGAQGTVFSDGAGVVLLKRLSDAIADGNPVVALITGGAINNDGGLKASFTAPSSEGQAAVIAMAHDNAGVDARSISYVETHGTATPVGDPIEIEGLTRAFRRSTADCGFCRIGSLKSNVGHMVIAAGVSGVIKTALALSERRIPASVHFESPNPAIDFAGSPFTVSAGMTDWYSDGAPRRAGVSSFGVGGTNAHAIMEEAPILPPSEPAVGPQLLVLSARTPAALGQAVARLADHLEAQPDANLADVAWTLAIGRKAFAHRVAICAADVGDAIATLRDHETRAAAARSRPAHLSDVVFLFPGQGATYPGMGRALYEAEPAFQAAFDECADALLPAGKYGLAGGFDLRECVFGNDPDAMLPTAIMQPATFAIEYSLARLWMSHGVVPAAMIGHSIGEFVAAALAGVFTTADAIGLVVRRGALMQALPAGSMLSVRVSAGALLPRLPAELSLAAENAPGACVVSGPADAIASFQALLEDDGVACRALRTSHAFHSAMMDPAISPFLADVAAVTRGAPQLALISTVTGELLDADTAMSPDYWARHLRDPVRFTTALERVLDMPSRVLLEVGPRATLSALARQHPGMAKYHIVSVATLADTPATEQADFRRATGQLWSRGVQIDPAGFDQRLRRHRVRLPTYPFERQRYWIEAALPASNIVPHPANPFALEPALLQIVTTAGEAEKSNAVVASGPGPGRRPRLLAQVRDVFESVAGVDLSDADIEANFIELGLDSLMLTQVAIQLQKAFAIKVTFRQLMSECGGLDRLANMLDNELPPDAVERTGADTAAALPGEISALLQPGIQESVAMATTNNKLGTDGEFTRQVIAQQMQLMAQQLALLSGTPVPSVPTSPVVPVPEPKAPIAITADAGRKPVDQDDEVALIAHTTYDVKKAFGAIARIEKHSGFALSDQQRGRLDAFIERYVARTRKSKDYTQAHRRHMADPRVVNGFCPLLKEIVYQIVVERSKGAHLYDLDGNKYVDALNGFGISLFGWQPDFVLDAVRRQLDLGYEIGPQHPLAGEVAQLICEVTGHERAALCNTGSEAVLGALRIARTVTGRETVVVFAGSYHGIVDEMLVRGTRKLRAVPAAPGILSNTSEHVLVLDYGTAESMQIIRERAHELAAVLVEPVQSRRPDFQPREFLHELRQVTRDAGALLVFDEVVTGFRAHPAGAQGLFGIQADLATYGKVVGGGYPIGVIAGKRDFMDALDGGHWQFGDDSVPEVGVTYFAGTFVRHPLALAAAKAVLTHIQAQGPQLQERLNSRVAAMVDELNAFCAERGAPVQVKQFSSVWKTVFLEDHPLQVLLFAMMRSRGVHILDNFPCFLTTAHSETDFRLIIDAFKASLVELQEAAFLPRHNATPATVMDPALPAIPGARLGRDPDGQPAWFVPHPDQSGRYVRVNG